MATAGNDGQVKLWDAATYGLQAAFTGHTDAVMCLAFSPDGCRLATAGADRTVKIWDLKSAQLQLDIQAHEEVNASSIAS